MEDRTQRMRAYRRARRKFACIAYTLSIVWMALALIQCVVVSLIPILKLIFIQYYWISVICFGVAMVLITLFIFFEKVRFIKVLNVILTILIVELVIIGLFALAARSLWKDVLMWFLICLLLLFLFIMLGTIIPHDLTVDVVTLFVVAFIFLVATIFFTMLHIIVDMPYSFVVLQVFISIVVLLFVMYHAQTINGNRFAEIRLNDYLLASLILFHDFIIIFLLTFYAQIVHHLASKPDPPTTPTTTTATTSTSSEEPAFVEEETTTTTTTSSPLAPSNETFFF